MAMPKRSLSRDKLTQDGLKELLSYDCISGRFTWLKPTANNVKAGSIAGGKNKDGYIQIRIYMTLYQAHRLAWLYVHGTWPESEIDHKDEVKTNNAIANLREATRKQNAENRSGYRNNTSGFRGVHYARGKWVARVTQNGKKVFLGNFDSVEQAGEVAATARAAMFTHAKECTGVDHGK